MTETEQRQVGSIAFLMVDCFKPPTLPEVYGVIDGIPSVKIKSGEKDAKQKR